MYDQLLKILADCLRPAISNSSGQNRPDHKRKTSSEGSGNQDSEYQNLLFKLLPIIYYHFIRRVIDIVLLWDLLGYPINEICQRNMRLKLSKLLAINDEERTNRFRVLDDTYNKESKLVSGYTYFLCVLENASGEHSIAVDILRKILISIDGLTHQNGEIDRVTLLTQTLMKEFEFKTMSDTKELYYYDSNHGIYVPAGECHN